MKVKVQPPNQACAGPPAARASSPSAAVAAAQMRRSGLTHRHPGALVPERPAVPTDAATTSRSDRPGRTGRRYSFSRIGGPAVDPLDEEFDLLIRQRFVRRHLKIGVVATNGPDEQALFRFSRDDGRTTTSPFGPSAPRIERQPAFHFPRGVRMTFVAVRSEQRFNGLGKEAFIISAPHRVLSGHGGPPLPEE